MASTPEMARYDAFCGVRCGIHSRLAARITPEMLERALDEIGTYAMDEIDLDTEVGHTVLTDFILYHLRENGKTLIECELGENPPPEGSDERMYLEAMTRPVFGILEVLKIRPGMGFEGGELRSGAQIFVFDRGMGSTASPGMLVAGNLVCLNGLWAFTGASLPLPDDAAFSFSILPPFAPCRWRLDMLYGGKTPQEVLDAIAAEEAELNELVEELDDSLQGGKRKKKKDRKPKAAPTPPDPEEEELSTAANVIAMAMEGGAGEMIKYR